MEDVASCFTDFVANDNVGLIATTHLRIADASKLHGADPRCKVLADKYSLAVDTAKTGVHVPLHEIPPFGKSRPDFLAYEGSNRAHYESQRALGQLFRAIPDARVALDPTSSFVDDSTSPHLDSLRTRLVRSAQELFGFKPLPLNDELIAMCASLRRSFCAELQLLAVVGHYPRRQGKSLSEVEVFVGSVAAESGGKGARDKKGAKEAATALRFRMSSLGQGVEDMLGKGCLGDNFSAAWACWDEALAVDEAEFGVKSFRWLCASMALTYLERIEEKGAAWREDLSVPPTPASTPGSSSRLGSRSATPSQAAHGTPLDRLVKPPSAPSTNTKTTRRKEREAAALKLAEERRRLDALAEKDVKGPGAWVVDVAYQEEGPEEGWGVEDWGTTAPKKAPVATAAPLPSKPAWGGAGAGRGAEWSGRGRGAGGEDGRFPTLDISRGRGRGVMSGVAAPTPSPPILRPTPTPPRSTSSIRSTSALSTNSSVANAPAPPPPAARNDNSPLSIRPAQIPTRPAPAPAPPTTGWDEPSSAASSNDGWGVEWGPTAEQDSAKEAAGKGGASAWGSGWG